MSILISIITPTYNCKEKIVLTLNSVLTQSFLDFEYLIIDGSSVDGTCEVIDQIQDPRVRVVSEPDLGIYDAMNKGVSRANGRYLLFLGAGDCICPGALEEMSKHLPLVGASLIYGNVYWRGRIYDGEFSPVKMAFQNICHQAIFYSREIFDLIGGFDTQYQILADWEINLRCYGDLRIRIHYVPLTISFFEDGGISGNRDFVFERNKDHLIKLHLGWIVFLKFRSTMFKNKWSSKIKRRLRLG